MGWTYSDTNYIVLGMILERIIGTTYYSELQKRLLGPLRLEHTVPAVKPVIPGLSQGYLGTGADNPFGFGDAILVNGRLILSPQWEWTGGGIASTSEDMARWAKLLYEGSAFPEGLMEQYLDGVATAARGGPEESVETGFRYGLGVFLRSTRHGTAYGHAGYAPGHLSEMLYFPRHRTAVAVQINTTIRGAAGRPLVEFLYELMDVVEEAAK
jgi:D-alanyl-D-alanine carboxypeptidase